MDEISKLRKKVDEIDDKSSRLFTKESKFAKPSAMPRKSRACQYAIHRGKMKFTGALKKNQPNFSLIQLKLNGFTAK